MIALDCKKVNEIASLLNISPQNLNGYLDRNTFIKFASAEFYKRKININWIKTGQGDMHESPASGVSENNSIYSSKINIADLKVKSDHVLRSNTAYSKALKDIIVAYYEATICQEELAEKQNALDILQIAKES